MLAMCPLSFSVNHRNSVDCRNSTINLLSSAPGSCGTVLDLQQSVNETSRDLRYTAKVNEKLYCLRRIGYLRIPSVNAARSLTHMSEAAEKTSQVALSNVVASYRQLVTTLQRLSIASSRYHLDEKFL